MDKAKLQKDIDDMRVKLASMEAELGKPTAIEHFPKIGEYCWFWNKGTTITILELLEIVDDGNRKYFAAMPNIPHSLGGYYQYCEPFRGTLPTKLRN